MTIVCWVVSFDLLSRYCSVSLVSYKGMFNITFSLFPFGIWHARSFFAKSLHQKYATSNIYQSICMSTLLMKIYFLNLWNYLGPKYRCLSKYLFSGNKTRTVAHRVKIKVCKVVGNSKVNKLLHSKFPIS